ncbi:MAG: hypothetical protein ABFE07_22190, partial [Armatimonadia bacterium]
GDLVAGMPAGLERIILRCLAKDPSQRFNNGRDLAAALRAQALPRVILRPGYTPPVAQPQQTSVMLNPPVPPRSRTNPLIIVLASVGAIALIVGLIAFGAMLSQNVTAAPSSPPSAVYTPPSPGVPTPVAPTAVPPGPGAPPTTPESPFVATKSEEPAPPEPPAQPQPSGGPEKALRAYVRLCNSGDCSGAYACFSALRKQSLSYDKYANQVFSDNTRYEIMNLGETELGCNPEEAAIPLRLELQSPSATSYWSGDVALVREGDAWKIEKWGLKKE